MSNKVVGASMSVSERRMLEQLRRKHGLKSKSEALRLAVRLGLQQAGVR